MKKKIAFLCICTTLLAGCGSISPSNKDEAVVTFKNGEKISVDELYEKVKDEHALNSLISMIDLHILEKEFPDHIEVAKSYAENYVKSWIEQYGGEDEFLSALQQGGYSTIDAYKDYLYLSYMQSHAVEEYAKLIVTDKEIEKYYNEKAQGDVEISHILITANITDDMSEEETEKAEKEAKDKAQALIKEINGDKDPVKKFKELVKANSKDDATKDKDGSLGKVTYGDLDSNYDELLDAAYRIKDGEVYGEVVTTELGYHIVLKTKSYEKEKLDDLKDEIRTILSKDLLKNDTDISIEALEYYRKEYKVDIKDSELNKQYNQYINKILESVNTPSE